MVNTNTPAFTCHHKYARVLTALSMSDNAFVGHYKAGNIQYTGHQSHGNNYSCTGKKLLIFTIDVAHI